MPAKRGRPSKATATNGGGITLTGTQAAPATLSREQELLAQIDALKAQVAAKPARQQAEEYPEPETSVEVAQTILSIANKGDWTPLPGAEFIRDMHSLMVEYVPGTAKDGKPYGEARLVTNQKGNKMNMLKPALFGSQGSDTEREARNWYIKLGQLSVQLSGACPQYRQPKPLTEDQINGILRPAVDFLREHKLVNIQ